MPKTIRNLYFKYLTYEKTCSENQKKREEGQDNKYSGAGYAVH